MLDWKLYLEAMIAQMENAFREWQFPAVVGSHCDYCVSSADCPLPAATRSFRGEVRTEDDAKRAAIAWEMAGRQRTDLWNALKGYFKNHEGRVRFGRDLELYLKKVESERVKPKVEVFGGKFDGKTALKMAMDKVNDGVPLQLDWETFYTPSVSTRLTRRKLTPAELKREEEGK
jgi:hypothetical protein